MSVLMLRRCDACGGAIRLVLSRTKVLQAMDGKARGSYCSHACAVSVPPDPFVCEACGKVTSRSRRGNDARRACSRECGWTLSHGKRGPFFWQQVTSSQRSEILSEWRRGLRQRSILRGQSSEIDFVECPTCERSFMRRPSGKRARQKYCSASCKNRAQYLMAKDRLAEDRRREKFRRVDVRVFYCAHCGKRKAYAGRFKGQRRKYCSDRCSTIASVNDYQRRKRAAASSCDGVIGLGELARRDGMACGICGKRVNLSLSRKSPPHPMSASVDHIVPLSEGGTHSWENVQLAHWICNVRKGSGSVGSQMRLVG